jgi:hypothetical protein
MAFITLAGTIQDPNSDMSIGDQIRFTQQSTTGQTLKGAISVVTVSVLGTYSVNLQYGLVLVEYRSVKTPTFRSLGIKTVNADNPATSIPELLIATVPVSSADLIAFQALLADSVAARDAAVVAQTAAEAAADAIDTFANLQALSPTITGTPFTCQERANAKYILQAAGYTALAGDATFANSRVAALQVSDVSLANFGTSADWDAAIELQISRMQTLTTAIIITAGIYTLTSQHILDGRSPVICESGVRFVTNDFTDSVFKFDIQVSRNATTGWKGGDFIFNFTGSNVGSAAVEISGVATALLSFCNFDIALVRGSESGLLNTFLPRTTSFGLENNVLWTDYKLKTQNVKYPFNFTTGSGTGNTHTNSKLLTISGGSCVRYAGTGCVVGDIVFTGVQAGTSGTADSAFIEIGDNTAYRSNIAFSACQIDAGLLNPFKFSQVGGVTYNNIKWFGSLGGSTVLDAALGVLEGSVILGKGVSDFKVSKIFAGLPSGSQTIKVCDVVVQNNSACKVEVNISGLVEGRAACMHTSIFHVRTQANASTAVLLSQENSPFLVVTITSSVAGNITSIFATIDPTTSGSRLNAQTAGVGGIFQLIQPY